MVLDGVMAKALRALEGGRPQEAQAHVRTLVEANPNDLDVQLLEARFYLETGDTKKALDALNHAVQAHPKAHLPYQTRAKLYWVSGDQQLAVKDAIRSAELAGPADLSKAMKLKAQMLMDLERFGEARPALEYLVQDEPDNPWFRTLLGQVFLKTGRLEQANEQFKSAYHLNPGGETQINDYATGLARAGETRNAVRILEPVAQATENKSLGINYASCLEKLERYEEAHTALQRLRNLHPQDADLAARALRVAINGKLPDRKALVANLLKLCEGDTDVMTDLQNTGRHLWALYTERKFEDLFSTKTTCLNLIPWSEQLAQAEKVTQRGPDVWQEAEEQGVPVSSRPVLFAACDPLYYEKHTSQFYDSALSHAPNCQVHVHVVLKEGQTFNPAQNVPQGVFVSTEVVKNCSKTFYACRRFTLLPKALRHHKQTILCMDIDSLVNRDPSSLLAGMGKADAWVYRRFGDTVIHQQSLAGFTAVRPTEAGVKFAQIVQTYCDHFLIRGSERWFLDQMSLFAAFYTTPKVVPNARIEPAPKDAINFGAYLESGFIWAAKGTTE